MILLLVECRISCRIGMIKSSSFKNLSTFVALASVELSFINEKAKTYSVLVSLIKSWVGLQVAVVLRSEFPSFSPRLSLYSYGPLFFSLVSFLVRLLGLTHSTLCLFVILTMDCYIRRPWTSRILSVIVFCVLSMLYWILSTQCSWLATWWVHRRLHSDWTIIYR